jgi:hypothetical protein
MGKSQINDRLNFLFSELRCYIEPMNGIPVTANHSEDLRNKKERELSLENRELESACPFLRTSWDPLIRYGYPFQDNLCYRRQKPQIISLINQEHICLKRHHNKCPIYLAEKNEKLKGKFFLSIINLLQR